MTNMKKEKKKNTQLIFDECKVLILGPSASGILMLSLVFGVEAAVSTLQVLGRVL